MKTTRRVLVASGAVVATLALAACSGGGSGTAVDEGAASGSENIELTFDTWIPTRVQWPELIEAFEAEYPGITIKSTHEENYETYRTNLDNAILAGETPDLFGMQTGPSFDDYAEYTLPVEEYGSEWIDGVKAEALEEATTEAGELAAVPILITGMQFYLYNQRLFEELGVDLPTTYDELVSVSNAATDAGYSPFAMGAADAWHDADFFVWMSNQYGEGGEIYKAALGEQPWDSEALAQAATDWQALFTDGVFQPGALTTITYPNARGDYFLAGKAIAMPIGSWHVGMSLIGPDQEQPGSAIEDDPVGMAVFPQIGPNAATATSGVDFALGLSSELEGEKLEAAAKFAEFMAVGTGQQLWVNTLQGFPVAEGIEVQLEDSEPEIAVESVKTVQETLAASIYPRKVNVPGWDSLKTTWELACKRSRAAPTQPQRWLRSIVSRLICCIERLQMAEKAIWSLFLLEPLPPKSWEEPCRERV